MRRHKKTGPVTAAPNDLDRLMQAEAGLEHRILTARAEAARVVDDARETAKARASALEAELAALPPVEAEALRQSEAAAEEIRARAAEHASAFAISPSRVEELAAEVVRWLVQVRTP